MAWSPNRSSRRGHPVKMLVLHGDAGRSDAGTLSHIANPDAKVSYHWLVGRDANHQLVPESEKAWHAGKSEWPGCTVGNSVNPTSIGVGFANDGSQLFPASQVSRGAVLCAEICERHAIPVHLVRGHFEVSPGRKTDPWRHFPWEHFWAEFCKASR